MPFNKYNVTRPKHTIPLDAKAATFVPAQGQGLNCSNPSNPDRAGYSPFLIHPELTTVSFLGDLKAESLSEPEVDSEELFQASSVFKEFTSTEELADTLEAYFKGSFSNWGLSVSVDAAYQKAAELKTGSTVVSANISSARTGEPLPDERKAWSGNDLRRLERIEALTDEDDRLDQFVSTFGSHYIDARGSGFRVSVLGRIASTVRSEVESFRASFQASFRTLNVDASMATTHRATLSQSNVEIFAEIVSGGIEPDNINILQGYDDLIAFLKGLKDRTIKIRRGPVVGDVLSYRATLLESFPQTAKILREKITPEFTADFPVPAGTVIAWSPPANSRYTDEQGVEHFQLPQGWAIADGSGPNIPDLRGKFVRGVSDTGAVGHTGGTDNHAHAAITAPADPNARLGAGGGNQGFVPFDYRYQVDVQPAEHLPSYCELIYLVRLP